MARASTKVKIEVDDELASMFDGFGSKAAGKAAAALKKTNYLKLGPGRHVIRILPGRKGALPFSEVFQHMIKPPGGKMFSINCPQKANGSHCPVCAKVDELRNSDIEADKAMGKDMQAKLQVSCNAIIRKPEGEGDIGLLRLPRGVYEEILALGKHPDVLAEYEDEVDENGDALEYVDLTHPTKGFDIRIDKSGTGLTTKYKVEVVGRSHNTPALKDLPRLKEVLKAMTDLETLAKIMSESEINMALMGPATGGEGQQPALAERTAERAAHDPIDASADEDDDGDDKDGIPF